MLRGCYLRAVLPGRIPELNRLDYETPNSGKPGRGWSRTEVVDDFVRFLDSLTLSNGKNVLVEKRLGHIFRLSTISGYVGRSKFVLLVRGGRTVVASLYAARDDSRIVGENGGPSKNAFPCGTLSCKHIGAPGEPDHFVASCERLLDDPERHLRGLCSFLSMRYEASVVSNDAR